jgi:hypothetical protein
VIAWIPGVFDDGIGSHLPGRRGDAALHRLEPRTRRANAARAARYALWAVGGRTGGPGAIRATRGCSLSSPGLAFEGLGRVLCDAKYATKHQRDKDLQTVHLWLIWLGYRPAVAAPYGVVAWFAGARDGSVLVVRG